jgi:hypothetical protein
VLALHLVHVAPQLAVLEPAEPRDLVAEPFEDVSLAPGLFIAVGHRIPPEGAILSESR